MSPIKIAALSGSLRSASYNQRLVHSASDAARMAGAEVELIDLRELALPMFDEDLEAARGLPSGALHLKAILRACDGFIISSPEHNSSITAALKNAIDWASRSDSPADPPLSSFRGKIAALFAMSPGGLGGLRGLAALRSILGNIGTLVLPDQVCIPAAHEAFDENGKLKDERKAKQVEALAIRLVETARKLKPAS